MIDKMKGLTMAIRPDIDTEEFEFQFSDGEEDRLASAVYQALGAASMCWSGPPQGVFDSSRAKVIGEKLLAFIDEEQNREEDEPVG